MRYDWSKRKIWPVFQACGLESCWKNTESFFFGWESRGISNPGALACFLECCYFSKCTKLQESKSLHDSNLFCFQPQDPFGAGSTEHFLKVFRCLLEANVSYCLLGDDTKYTKLLKTEMEPVESTCLKDFKESLGLKGGDPSAERLRTSKSSHLVHECAWCTILY